VWGEGVLDIDVCTLRQRAFVLTTDEKMKGERVAA
jgi:hypothetical protein